MEVRVINKSSNSLPKYAHPGDAGMDLYAEISEQSINQKFLFDSDLHYSNINDCWEVTIRPGGRALIPTELYTSFPAGYEIQIRSRSGLALKNAVIVLNCPGCIDAKVNKLDAIVGVLKRGELLESPEVDNQQPSLDGNVLEGPTTNGQIQLKLDGNADTSALLQEIVDILADDIV